MITPYDDLTPIELGASVFVKANKNMWRAVDEFGLERTGFDDEKEVMGIWDGEQFPLTVRPGLHAATFAPRLTRTPDGRVQLLQRLAGQTEDRLALRVPRALKNSVSVSVTHMHQTSSRLNDGPLDRVTGMIDGFLRLYDRCTPRWSNTSEVVAEMEWTDVVAQSMSEYMDLEGIDRRWTRELVEAATRVNYGQVSTYAHLQPRMLLLTAILECRQDSRP